MEKLRMDVDILDESPGPLLLGAKSNEENTGTVRRCRLYFENLDRAKELYAETLGLEISDELAGHHAKFDSEAGFICLERKGSEAYPSKDKSVLFFEVPELKSAIAAIGQEKFVHAEATWAVLHDQEGYNVLLLQKPA